MSSEEIESRDFLSVDWGTSRLRVALVTDGAVAEEAASDLGVARVFHQWREQGGGREEMFLDVLEGLLGGSGEGLPVMVSGMASSSLGLRELSYAGVPFALDGSGAVMERFQARGREFVLISGVSTGEDVLRGEETELMGLGAEEGLVILPGTHSKHAVLEGGFLTGFKTYLTGELFALLRDESVLKESLGGGEVSLGGREASLTEEFVRGVESGRLGEVTGSLFSVRARSLLQGKSGEENLAYLSGLLLGAECRSLVGKEAVFLVSRGSLGQAYEKALHVLGVAATVARHVGGVGRC